MKVSEIKTGKHEGEVIASLQNIHTKAMIRTVLNDPEITETEIGLIMVSDDNRVDIDFRGMNDHESGQPWFCSLDYPDLGVLMTILFMES